jgi:hypothetical protein
MLQEISRAARPLARPDLFPRAHRNAFEALESLARHGFKGTRAASSTGPFRTAIRCVSSSSRGSSSSPTSATSRPSYELRRARMDAERMVVHRGPGAPVPAGGRRPHAVGRAQREADADLVCAGRRAGGAALRWDEPVRRWTGRWPRSRGCSVPGLPDEADSPQPSEEEHPRPVRSRCRSGAVAETVARAESGGPERRKAFRADLAA